MTIKALLDMADGKTGIPAAPVDVRVPSSIFEHVPMTRVIHKAERRTVKGATWVYWYWTPEGQTPEGHLDPGYSGRVIA